MYKQIYEIIRRDMANSLYRAYALRYTKDYLAGMLDSLGLNAVALLTTADHKPTALAKELISYTLHLAR